MAAEVVLLRGLCRRPVDRGTGTRCVALTALRDPGGGLAGCARRWGVEAVWLAIGATTVVKGLVLAGLFAAQVGTGREDLD